jgi:hypothetical protein
MMQKTNTTLSSQKLKTERLTTNIFFFRLNFNIPTIALHKLLLKEKKKKKKKKKKKRRKIERKQETYSEKQHDISVGSSVLYLRTPTTDITKELLKIGASIMTI